MARERRLFSEEFKREAVKLVGQPGVSKAAIARPWHRCEFAGTVVQGCQRRCRGHRWEREGLKPGIRAHAARAGESQDGAGHIKKPPHTVARGPHE